MRNYKLTNPGDRVQSKDNQWVCPNIFSPPNFASLSGMASDPKSFNKLQECQKRVPNLWSGVEYNQPNIQELYMPPLLSYTNRNNSMGSAFNTIRSVESQPQALKTVKRNSENNSWPENNHKLMIKSNN